MLSRLDILREALSEVAVMRCGPLCRAGLREAAVLAGGACERVVSTGIRRAGSAQFDE